MQVVTTAGMQGICTIASISLFVLAGTFGSLAQTKKVRESFKVLDNGTVIIQNESVQDENCTFGNDGEIHINVIGGVSPYTFEWVDSLGAVVATSEDLIGVRAGEYTVTITDNTNCAATASFVVGYFCPYSCMGSLELVTIDPTSCLSADGQIIATLNTPGPYTYQFYRYDQYNETYSLIDAGTATGASFNRLFPNLQHGLYEIYVSTDSCNYFSSTELLTSDFFFASILSLNNASCTTPNGSIILNVVDLTLPHNFLVKWKESDDGTESSRIENSTNITLGNLKPGFYLVEVQDLDLGCIIQQSVSVDNAAPFLSVASTITPQTNCTSPNGSIAITVTGGSGQYNYEWFTPTGLLTTEDISNLTSGPHYLYISDRISGCTNDPSGNTYTVPNATVPPSATFTITNNTACSQDNGGINLTPTGTGPFSVSWYDELLNVFATTEDVAGIAPGKYGFQVTDQANGCSFVRFPGVLGSPVVNDLSLPAVSLTGAVINSTDCNGDPGNGSIDLTVTTSAATITYLWSGPAGFTSTNEDLSGLAPGDYTVTVSVECPINTPPVITPVNLSATTGQSQIDLNLLPLITDAENNFVIDSLKIIRQPVSGAFAEIIKSATTANLLIDYSGVTYVGEDSVRIEACDTLGACTQQEIRIDVEVSASVAVYNAVSPVGAPGNRYLRIDGLPASANRVTVYNRWGDVVFSVEDYDNSMSSKRFEGISNSGKELSSGTYFYKIEIAGSKTLTGYLSLKR